MADSSKSTHSPEPEAIPRETLIATAVTFLGNKDVKRHPLDQKRQFLRSKGLSEHEVQMACERAGLFTQNIGGPFHSHTALSIPVAPPHGGYVMRPSLLQRFIEVVNSVAAVSGIAYCIYLFYKRCIKPWLFGSSPPAERPKTVDESLTELESAMNRRLDELGAELGRVREEINRNSIKSDLDAIKGLLLNKRQFASPIVPPSIPAWQLAASQIGAASVGDEAGHGRRPNDDDKDNDTGSGSSETEIVTKNSDSSLEIM